MSAWKNINKQDAFVTTYVARKSWSTPSQSLAEYGIQVLYGQTGSNPEFYLSDGTLYSGTNVGDGEYQELVYQSLTQLYFQSFNSSSGELEVSSSYEHYLPTTLFPTYRTRENKLLVYSIPRELIGIELEDLSMNNSNLYVDEGYFEGNYMYGGAQISKTEDFRLIDPVVGEQIGFFIPEHGIVVINQPVYAEVVKDSPELNITWKSNQPIYTYNYNVKLSDYEFNLTQNPSALSGSNGDLADNVTGSYFQPYITTIGLYNDSNELIAVGKLAQPLPKSNNTETTIQIKLDI